MECETCHSRPATLEGLYCSFRCRSQAKHKKKPRKPPTTGSRERKARIRKMEKHYTADDWQRCLEYWSNSCAYCGNSGRMQQEHFYSVLDGGTYTPANIIPACGKCNSKKSNKNPLEWLLTQDHGIVTYTRIFQYFNET